MLCWLSILQYKANHLCTNAKYIYIYIYFENVALHRLTKSTYTHTVSGVEKRHLQYIWVKALAHPSLFFAIICCLGGESIVNAEGHNEIRAWAYKRYEKNKT